MKFDENYFTQVYIDYCRQNPPCKIKWYQSFVHQWINNRNIASILDIGCGYGLFLESLPVSWQRNGLDPAFTVLRKNHRKRTDIRYIGGTIEEMPFSGTFDLITAFDVLEHTRSLDKAARNIDALLSRDGIFLLVVPVIDGPFGSVVRLLDKDPTHRHMLSRAEWHSWVMRYFEPLWWCGIVRGLLFKKYYLHLPSIILRQFSPAIAIAARKAIPSKIAFGQEKKADFYHSP